MTRAFPSRDTRITASLRRRQPRHRRRLCAAQTAHVSETTMTPLEGRNHDNPHAPRPTPRAPRPTPGAAAAPPLPLTRLSRPSQPSQLPGSLPPPPSNASLPSLPTLALSALRPSGARRPARSEREKNVQTTCNASPEAPDAAPRHTTSLAWPFRIAIPRARPAAPTDSPSPPHPGRRLLRTARKLLPHHLPTAFPPEPRARGPKPQTCTPRPASSRGGGTRPRAPPPHRARPQPPGAIRPLRGASSLPAALLRGAQNAGRSQPRENES